MSVFPKTSATLMARIAGSTAGEDAADWARFWDTYSLAMRQFAAYKGGEENADDIVMEVMGKLVTVLREGRYAPEKGRLHSYLARMIVNEVLMMRRKAAARAEGRSVSIDASVEPGHEGSGTLGDILAVPEEETSPERLDADWRRVVLASAVEHVLTKTALSDRDRRVYQAYAQEGRPIGEVASLFGLSRNQVSQIKTRIDKRIVSVGRAFLSDCPN